MTAGSASWSFTPDDFSAMTSSLKRFLTETNSICALLVDRSGQLVTTVGDSTGIDTTTFATLTAADYSANDQLAKLVGEKDFASLFHQGEKSIYVADVARRWILVVIFDSRTTVGLVRLRMKAELDELTLLVDRVFSRGRNAAAPAERLLAGADDEIDKLFNN